MSPVESFEELGLPGGERVPEEEHADVELAAGSEAEPRTQWELFRRRFLRHHLGVLGLVILVVLFVACFGANWFAPRDEQDLLVLPSGPSWEHPFGIDQLGRDYLKETLNAGQVSLRIGLTVALLASLVGTAFGVVAGFFRGWVDQLLMRVTDLFLVVPQIVAIAIIADMAGRSAWTLSLALAAVFWMPLARITRGQTLALREREYVEAARAAGASGPRIMVWHILPNLIGLICVDITLAIAGAILTESALTFLGLGVMPPDISWGLMVEKSSGFVGTDQSYLIVFPGLMILVTVLAVNFLGDGLRDAFDPRSERR